MTRHLAISALRQAVGQRRPRNVVVVHSDRGGQFRARDFVAVLRARGLAGSTGRVAPAGDDAAMEPFHSLLQTNVLNQCRRQRRLGTLTPVEFDR